MYEATERVRNNVNYFRFYILDRSMIALTSVLSLFFRVVYVYGYARNMSRTMMNDKSPIVTRECVTMQIMETSLYENCAKSPREFHRR